MEKERKSMLYKISMMRRANAVLSLICVSLIFIHGLYDAIWMCLRGKLSVLPKQLAYTLMGLVVIHGVLSVVIAILVKKGNNNKDEKVYQGLNIRTIIQRSFGMMMLLLIPFHVFGMNNHLNFPLLHAILHPLFFLVVFIHTAFSCSKAFITLGIGNAKFIKIVDIITYILCGLMFIISIIGLYLVLYGSWLG